MGENVLLGDPSASREIDLDIMVWTDENVAVTYSYWDGSGHRREITVRRFLTIGSRVNSINTLCRFPKRRQSASTWSW